MARPLQSSPQSDRQSVVIPLRMTEADAARLDAIAKEGGGTRAGMARSILISVLNDDEAAHATPRQ